MSGYPNNISVSGYDFSAEPQYGSHGSMGDVSVFDDTKTREDGVPFIRSIRTARTSMSSPDSSVKSSARLHSGVDDQDPFKLRRDDVNTLYSEMYKTNGRSRDIPKITLSITGRKARSSKPISDPYAAASSANVGNTSVNNTSLQYPTNIGTTSHVYADQEQCRVPLVLPYASTASESSMGAVQDHANDNITDARKSIYKAIDLNTSIGNAGPTVSVVPEKQYLEEKRVLSGHIEEQRRDNSGLVSQLRVLHQKIEFFETEKGHIAQNYEEEVRVLREKLLEKDIETFLLQKQVNAVESDLVQYRIKEQHDQNVQGATLERLQSDVVILRNKNQKLELELHGMQTTYSECHGEKGRLESRTREQGYTVDSLQSQCETLRREHKFTLEERNDQHGKVVMLQARVDEQARQGETRRVNEDVSGMQNEKDQLINMQTVKLESASSVKKEQEQVHRERSDLRAQLESEQNKFREYKQVAELREFNLVGDVEKARLTGSADSQELRMLRQELVAKSDRIEQLQREQREEEGARRQHQCFVPDNSQVNARVAALQEQLESRKERQDQLTEQMAVIKGKLSSADNQIGVLESRLTSKDEQMAVLESKLASKEEQLEILKSTLTTKESHITSKDSQLAQLEAQVRTQGVLSLNNDKNAAMEAMEADLSNKVSQIDLLRAQCVDKDSKIASIKEQVVALELQLSAKDDNINVLKSSVADLESRISSLNSNYDANAFPAKVHILEQELSRKTSALDEYNKVLGQKESRIQSLENELVHSNSKPLEAMRDQKNMIDQLTDKNRDLMSENATLKSDMVVARTNAEREQDAVLLKQKELEVFFKQNQEQLEVSRNRLQEAVDVVTVKDAELIAAHGRTNGLLRDVAVLESRLAEVRDQLSHREADFERLFQLINSKSDGNGSNSSSSNRAEQDLLLQKVLDGMKMKDEQNAVERQELRQVLEREMEARVQAAVAATREQVRVETERELRTQFESEQDAVMTSSRTSLDNLEYELDRTKTMFEDCQRELDREMETAALQREQQVSAQLAADETRRALAVAQHQTRELERRVQSPEARISSPGRKAHAPLPLPQPLPQHQAVKPSKTNLFSTPAPRTAAQTPSSSINTLRDIRQQSQQLLEQLNET